ncbi:MAG: RseA family anti-sigma factor [Methylococcales bacterium]
MQEDLDIKISMLMDDELACKEALKIFNRIRNESVFRAKWIRYNIASCACKAQSMILTDFNFFDRVSKALEQEPAIVAPKSRASKKLARISSVSLALAASAAVVAVIIWSGMAGLPGSSPPNTSDRNALAVSTPIEAPSAPIQAPAPWLPAKLDSAHKQNFPKRLNDYLITHNESTYTTGAQTMMPYARVISYSKDK